MMNLQTQFPTSSQDEIMQNMKNWLTETLGDSADFMIPELAEMFLEDAPPLIAKIQTGFNIGDGKQVKEAAHTLKGSSASMGLHAFSSHCKKIETFAKSGDLAESAKSFPMLEAEYAQVKIVLEELVE
ncbi:MAG: Hpt domain-containing protein [Chloroflexi bacterium]|nr:MAG: Hpt domain-containing protein [Chloroflexota bacterium]